jgi:hypothetical protein
MNLNHVFVFVYLSYFSGRRPDEQLMLCYFLKIWGSIHGGSRVCLPFLLPPLAAGGGGETGEEEEPRSG